jgi:hypothetical protein
MTDIHVLFPSDVGHMYIAKRGDLPHYQEVFSKFVLALEWYDNQMHVYLYMRGEDHSNHFMLGRNLAKTVQPFVDQMHPPFFVLSKEEGREAYGNWKAAAGQFSRFGILLWRESNSGWYFRCG